MRCIQLRLTYLNTPFGRVRAKRMSHNYWQMWRHLCIICCSLRQSEVNQCWGKDEEMTDGNSLIFISHAQEDLLDARWLAGGLEKLGWSPYAAFDDRSGGL